MSLQLIIGRSGTGKSELMYRNILQDEKNNKNILVFVPDFARVVAEQEYFKYTKNKGMINTKIITINRFTEQNINIKELYKNKEFLPELSRKFIVKKCIEDNSDVFNIFKKAKNTQGFIDKISKIFNIFEMEKIDEETVKTIADKNDFLKIKFNEIYDIYKIVKNETSQRFVTSIEQLDFFLEEILNDRISKLNSNTNIYFDGYNNFNNKELSFIQVLLKKGLNVTITLDLDIENIDKTDIFEIPCDTYKKLKNIAKECNINIQETILKKNNIKLNMLTQLQNKIFNLGEEKYTTKDDTVKICLLKNPQDEINFIANDIQKKLRENSAKYSDFKLYYNNSEMYDLIISKTFEKYNIPVYINGSNNVTSNTLVVLLLCLLKQVKNGFNGVKTENIIQILKTGLTEFSQDKVNLFENYINEFGIKLYNFKNEFKNNNDIKNGLNIVYDLEEINILRDKIYNLVCKLKNKLERINTSCEATEIIYNFLHEQGIIQRYSEQLEIVKEYSLDEYNRKKQVLQYIYEVMDNITLSFDNLSIEEYIDLFEYGIENIEVSSIPPYIDQVEVCDIDSTRSIPRKYVYIIGVFENGLPILSNDEGIFSDKELLKLKELGIEISNTSDARNNMALFNVYKAINSCNEKLYFTLPAAKLTGENLRLSPLIWRIKEILEISAHGNITKNGEVLGYTIQDVFNSFVSKLNDIDLLSDEQKNEMYSEYLVLSDNLNYKQVLEYDRKKDYLSSDVSKNLYDKDIISSISRLERFNSCPLNYFANYVLKLKEKKEYKLSSLDMGSIMHKIVEDYSKFLVANNLGFQDILDDEKVIEKTKKQISKSIDDIFDTLYIKYNSSEKYVYYKQKLNKGMFNIIKNIALSFTQSEFRPLGFEVEFDNGKLFAPIEIALDNGNKMFLRGKIDRIDIAKIKDNVYLRVVDYKSSNKDLKLSDIKEGMSLQLMTYMSALLDNKEKIDKEKVCLPAALTYFTLNTDVLSFNANLSEEKTIEEIINSIKMKGIYLSDVDVLNSLDNKFEDSKHSYIDITKRRLNNSEKALDEQNFLKECSSVKNILKNIGNELVKGKVSTAKKEKPCEYCAYSAFCRKKLKN